MGKETLPDGSYYEGHWEHDKPEGKGIMVYPGGDVKYEGHFRQGEFIFQFCTVHTDHSVARLTIATTRAGLPDGQGLMEFTNVSNRA